MALGTEFPEYGMLYIANFNFSSVPAHMTKDFHTHKDKTHLYTLHGARTAGTFALLIPQVLARVVQIACA